MVNEGHDSTMEFAEGNFGMFQGALEYARDVTPPQTTIEYSAAQTGSEPIDFRFNWINEPSVIHYTTDGTTPSDGFADLQQPGSAPSGPGAEAREPRRP